MTEKITLELTLDELKLIDKHLWISVATKPILEKIKNAYPKPDVIEIDGVKYQRVDEPTKPAEEVFGRLENKYKKYGGTSYMTDEVIDRVMEKWKTDPPSFLKFEMGKTLEQIVERWWEDVFMGTNSHWDMKTAIDDLVDRIYLWFPAEQDSSGTQSVETIIAVDTHNELLRKIKSKIHNKKA